jgi:hypothetical protein
MTLGVDPQFAREAAEVSAAVSVLRPFIKVELSASIVPGSALDKDRWYRYSAGLALAPGESSSATLTRIVDGKRQVLEGAASLISAQASDSLQGQTCTTRFPLTGLVCYLAPLVRPMDRLRLSVTVAGYPDWLLFDGVVRSVRGSRRAGSGWSAELQLSSSGVEAILGGAVFNWQGFIHPASDILQGAEGKTLMEAIGESAKAPELIIRAFIESAIRSAMGLKVGDTAHDEGLSVLDYISFPEGSEWSSWPDVAYPLPWNLIQGQSGASFWQVAQAVSEPVLHEFFIGYREQVTEESSTGGKPGPLRPALVHRPRPFPGVDPKWDTYWKALRVVKVGGTHLSNVMGVDDVLSGESHPNAFHWAGLGLGDHSKEAFFSKLFWGWASSNELINRYGYSSTAVVSKLAPIAPGAPIQDYLGFAKDHLLHFAGQEAPLSLLRSRSLDAPFLPVRPGEVLEDHSLGSDSASIVTGYVVSTDFTLRAAGDGISMSMGATVVRSLRGTDAAGYPDAVRALLPDLTLKRYAGKGVAEPGPMPAVDGVYKPPAVAAAVPQALDSKVYYAIKAAAARQSVPPWFVAHILQNETGFGRFWGNTPAEVAVATKKGMGQITSVAHADLVSIGYTNPDGSPFTLADRADVVKNIHATAAFLKRCQALIEDMPGGFPSNGQSYYSWVARAYRFGAGPARTLGASLGWQWPAAGEAFPDYARYWSPDGIKKGQAMWGYLG